MKKSRLKPSKLDLAEARALTLDKLEELNRLGTPSIKNCRAEDRPEVVNEILGRYGVAFTKAMAQLPPNKGWGIV